MRDKIVDVMPEMKTGKELLDCLRERPEYPACIWGKKQHGAAGGIVRHL